MSHIPHFWHKTSPQNIGSVTVMYLLNTNFIQKSVKKQCVNPEKTVLKTKGQANGQSWIHMSFKDNHEDFHNKKECEKWLEQVF